MLPDASRSAARPRAAGATLCAWALCAVFALPALGARGVETRPRIAQYVCKVGLMSEAQLDTLSWYDLVLLRDSPATVARIRSRNPDIRLFFNWMPQNLSRDWENETWWYPDTTWSLISLSQFYAQRNDWYLRDTAGNRIREANGYAANWTRYCPKGTYGTSAGLNYVEWLTQVAIPQVVTSGRFWPKWGPGTAGYDGLDLEILVDCVGSWGWQNYANADPDRDGLPEGVYADCESGGADDSLSVLYREMNEVFHAEIARLQDEGVLVLLNSGTKRMSPSWRTDVSGVKLERWMSYHQNPWVDWWESFYGIMDYGEVEMLGPGYRWAEDFVGHHGIDGLEGWDQTLLEVIVAPHWTPAKKERLKRWGLGTSLLGDGFFVYTTDECGLYWQPEFEWDLGEPLGGYARETFSGQTLADTLYTRQFRRGFVEVNPNGWPVRGVPAEDSRFGFWQTVEDLQAEPDGPDAARVTFTAPLQALCPVDLIELRFARFPITPENWGEAVPHPAGPFLPAPGSPVQIGVAGLDPGETWYFAARNRVYGRWEPGTSNLASVALPPGGPDLTPPAAIGDLQATAAGTSWIRLEWSAPADGGPGGPASAYRIRHRAGGPIETEQEWAAALDAAGTYPIPAAPESAESYTVPDLSPGTAYGFAIRAVDAAGNLAPLSNRVLASTLAVPPPPPPANDTIPPSPVGSPSVAERGQSWLRLSWLAPGDDGNDGTASSYAVRWLAGRAIATEEDWTAAQAAAGSPPVPIESGREQTFLVEGLQPGSRYGLAVRAADEAGNLGGIPAPLVAQTLPPDPPPPAPGPPGSIEDLAAIAFDSTSVALRWTAPDDGEGGPVAQYRLAILSGDSLRTDADLARCSVRILGAAPRAPGLPETTRVESLSPGTLHGFAVFARDEAGQFGGTGNFAHARTADSPRLPPPPPPPDGPPPDPIRDLAAFGVEPTRLWLVWTAPGGGPSGRASRYEVRRLNGRAIESEDAWVEATPLDASAIAPQPAGEPDSFLVAGLEPESAYGFAVRASADGTDLAPLGNSLFVRTPPLPDSLPPGAIEDLQAEPISAGRLLVRWSATTDDRPEPLAYRLALRSGAAIESESDWAAADTSRVFDPGDSSDGTRFETILEDLAPSTIYGLCARAVDAAGHRSPLPSRPVAVTMPAPPDSLPPRRILDLALADAGPDWLRLRWTAPADSGSSLACSAYEVAWLEGAAIEGEFDWARAARLAAPPSPPAPPGGAESCRIEGLPPGTRFGLAVRARDAGGRLAPLSNRLVASTLEDPPPDPPPDTTAAPDPPPAAIADLAVRERGADWADLAWTESGEDSLEGTAATLELRFLAGAPIRAEEDWLAAAVVSGGPEPAPGGTARRWRWEGIDADREGGLSLRSRDSAGQWSPLVPGAWLDRFSPPAPPPPAGPSITSVAVQARRAVLTILHGEHGGSRDDLDHYDARLRSRGGDDWESAPPVRPPEAGPPGAETVWTIEDLLPDQTYLAAVRAVGVSGGASPFTVVEFRTTAEDLAPPDPPGAPSIEWSPGGAELTLSWPPASDPRVVGYLVYGESRGLVWHRLTASPVIAPTLTLARPSPEHLRRVAVRSVTGDGTESALSPAVGLWVEEWQLDGPFPHPVQEACRIRVRVPADFPPRAALRVEILGLDGSRTAVLHDGVVAPGLVVDCRWDRRSAAGTPVAPGFYQLLCSGGGRRTLRTIYLSP